MYVILWEYQVKPERQAEFEKIYASDGEWAELFKRGAGYIETELLRDEKQSLHYLTIDRWSSKGEYESFLLQWQAEYQALDARCEGLTSEETCLGRFGKETA